MLLTCPDCTGRVSSLATACPACGRPVGGAGGSPVQPQATRRVNAFRVALAIVSVVVGIILVRRVIRSKPPPFRTTPDRPLQKLG